MKNNISLLVKNNMLLYTIYHRLKFNIFLNNPQRKISGKRNVISREKSTIFHNSKICIKGNDNTITLSNRNIISNLTILISGNNNKIIIDENVRFSRESIIWIEDNNCKLLIGKNTTFEGIHLALTENNSTITIGEDCMFAYDIDIRTGDSHSIIDVSDNQRINYAKDITIGNHVWIASHVSILKGGCINDNSVVATRSVITKAFTQRNVLLAGMPAQLKKDNITWLRERI